MNNQTARAALCVTASALGFTLSHGVIRHVGEALHSFEIAFFRNLFGLLVLVPFLMRHGGNAFHTRRLSGHLLRGGLQIGAMLMFYTALMFAPLAEVSALSFTAPLFGTIGAVLILGERIRLRRVVALLVGFIGALVILRPGVVPFNLGAGLVLGSSVMWALAMVVIKRLSATESSLTLTAYMGVVMTPLSLVPALAVWEWPTPTHLAWLVLLGSLGAGAQYVMAEGFRLADATTVMPFDFSRLIWASVVGYFAFGEVPVIWTYAGGALIFGSTVYIAYREGQAERAARAKSEKENERGREKASAQSTSPTVGEGSS